MTGFRLRTAERVAGDGKKKKAKSARFCMQTLADFAFLRDPLGARTQDPNIKSVVLYQLS